MDADCGPQGSFMKKRQDSQSCFQVFLLGPRTSCLRVRLSVTDIPSLQTVCVSSHSSPLAHTNNGRQTSFSGPSSHSLKQSALLGSAWVKGAVRCAQEGHVEQMSPAEIAVGAEE